MRTLLSVLLLAFVTTEFAGAAESDADRRFEQLASRYVDEFPALAPVSASYLGDHRFDGKLNEVSQAARQRSLQFYDRYLTKLSTIDSSDLTRANQVDYALMKERLTAAVWRIRVLDEGSWNPLVYTRLSGGAIYSLLARDYAPLPERLSHVADRLEQFPRLFIQIREMLDPERVPPIHADTAIKQNRGVLKMIDQMVLPHLDKLSPKERQRMRRAIRLAGEAVEEHQRWLEKDLWPNAGGNFRIGRKLYDRKLTFSLRTPLSRDEVRAKAVKELRRVRNEMYDISRQVYAKANPYTAFPNDPSPAYRQAMIRAGLEMACLEMPPADKIVESAKETLRQATDFVREKDLVTIPPDPVEIIVMPEFRRGVSIAYCDSPGALEVGQKTFYAVAPMPKDWTPKQIRSFLREYNTRSLANLTVHEAMPGHFLQIAHSNRYPGKLRALFAAGTFIEGWGVYAEHMMAQEGFLDSDPLMQLVVHKWYLRGIANAILDQSIHAGDMTRDQAMRLMIEDTFQEEREAAAKWVRAQLTSAQLSTYFVGVLEHWALRREAESAWGDEFDLKSYHDRVLSFGSPPVAMVRALLLEKPIPGLSAER